MTGRIRRAAAVVIILAAAAAFSGCDPPAANNDAKFKVVCTIFPIYDWTRRIIGDNTREFELTLLLNNFIDLHNYQPSVKDVARISGCDLLICVGGVSDGWVDGVVRQAANKNIAVIKLLERLGDAAKTEGSAEGAEGGHEHGADEDGHGDEYDEHVWLSLINARLFCAAIAETLAALDVDDADIYVNNAAAYMARLSELDRLYRETVDAAPVKDLLFGDRFPFRYLLDDYGLNYHSVFAGCSAETEASFQTIVRAAETLDALRLKYVLVTEDSDKKIAETVIRESRAKDQKILVLNAVQSVAPSDIASGATYLDIMQKNLEILREALN